MDRVISVHPLQSPLSLYGDSAAFGGDTVADPFPPTPKSDEYLSVSPPTERTDPNIVLAKLKHQAQKAAKGNRLNFGLILGVLGIVGGFAAYLLGQAEALAQAQVAPVRAQVEAGGAAFSQHVKDASEVHREIKEQLHDQGATLHAVELNNQRNAIMLEQVVNKLGMVPPPPVKTDGGP